jgi:hypothetical protein
MEALRLKCGAQLGKRATVQHAHERPIVAAGRLDRIQDSLQFGLVVQQIAALALVGATDHHQDPQGPRNLDRRGRAQPGDRAVQRHPRVQHQRPCSELGQH